MTVTADHRRNNFDLIRLVAAISVLFSHSFAVAGKPEPASWLDPANGTWGQLGVLVFFSLSGYLIASSWVRDPSPSAYLIKRVFRIIPALAVMTVVTVFLIGPFATSSSPTEYFSSYRTWLYPVVKTLLFIPGNVDPPGIFAGNPWVGVNPSLWTLPVEFTCYLLLMATFLLVSWAFASRHAVMAARMLCGAAAVIGAVLGSPQMLAVTSLSSAALITQTAIVMTAFFTGAFLFLLRDRIRFTVPIALIVAAVATVLSIVGLGTVASGLLMPYLVLTLALGVPRVPLGRFSGWDLSYAAYLYGFPVQQLIVYLTRTDTAMVVFPLAVAIVLPVAALSWRFIERPALRYGRRIARQLAVHRHSISPAA